MSQPIHLTKWDVDKLTAWMTKNAPSDVERELIRQFSRAAATQLEYQRRDISEPTQCPLCGWVLEKDNAR